MTSWIDELRDRPDDLQAPQRLGDRWRNHAHMTEDALAAEEHVERVILAIRGRRVILDKDLAVLYGVSTGSLNKAVSRNLERFPDDFMLRLTAEEFRDLKFQFGTSSWGGTRHQRSRAAASAFAPRARGPAPKADIASEETSRRSTRCPEGIGLLG